MVNLTGTLFHELFAQSQDLAIQLAIRFGLEEGLRIEIECLIVVSHLLCHAIRIQLHCVLRYNYLANKLYICSDTRTRVK